MSYRVQYLNCGTILQGEDFAGTTDLASLIQEVLKVYWEDSDGQCIIWEGNGIVATLVTIHRAKDEDGFPSGIVSVTTYDSLTPDATLYRAAYLGSEDGQSFEGAEVMMIEASEIEAWM